MTNKRIHPVDSDAAMAHNYPNQYPNQYPPNQYPPNQYDTLEKGNPNPNPYPYPYPPYPPYPPLPNPAHPNQPQYYPPRKRSGAMCCFRCLCCCYCCLLVVVIVLASVLLFMVRLYLPQVPTYEIHSFKTTKFQIQQDSAVEAEFVVMVKADNPNGKLGFTYGEGSSIEVRYHDTILCGGTFPSFQQEPFNETIMKVDLKGRSHFDSDLQEAYMGERNHERITLIVRVRVPMSVQGGGYSTLELMVGGLCTLVVDSLDPKKETNIVAHSCAPVIGL